MNKFATISELLVAVGGSYDFGKALSIRRAGLWSSVSTRNLVERVRCLALALDEAGVKRGETVGIMGSPCPCWILSDMAIMSIGAVTVPFFPDEPDDTRAFKIKDASVKHLFVLDDQALREAIPHKDKFRTLICNGCRHSAFEEMSKVEERGLDIHSQKPDRFEELSNSVKPDDLCSIYYTSGSTGVPKGVEITHRNIISLIEAASKRVPLFKTDVAISCLPLAHSFERFMVYYYMSSGVPVYFNADIHDIAKDMKDVSPTVMAMVPRILEKMYVRFNEKIENGAPINRSIGKWAVAWALKRDPENDVRGFRGRLARLLVFRKLSKALGGRLRVVISGSAALPPELYRFYINADVPVYQGYGLTEASPVLSANGPDAHEIGTVGQPFPGVDIRIADDGEILAKGPNIMRGYHNRPDLTNETIDSDGWLHTGDLGDISPNGYLSITGRAKHLMKCSNGEYVAPEPIEQALCKSLSIEGAIVVAEGRPFVSCLIFPQGILTVGERRGVNDTIDKINAGLEHWEQIKEFKIIYDELSVANGLLTPTMKIRRHIVLDKYSEEIEKLYEEKE